MRRGFTLIELLVVVSMIALLVGLLLPVLAAARDRAVRVQCQANLRSVHQTFHVYAADHDNRVPLGYRGGLKQWNTMIYSGWSDPFIFVLFGRLHVGGYMPSPQVFYCPAETDPDQMFDTDDNVWPPGDQGPDPQAHVHGGYGSAPVVDWEERELPERMPRLDELANQAVFSDTANQPQRVDSRHVTGVHVLYADSAVRWIDRRHFDEPLAASEGMSATNNEPQREIWAIFNEQRGVEPYYD